MKHILPILTASLALAATTASANFYYEYYQNPEQSTVKEVPMSFDGGDTYDISYHDTFTYKNFEMARYSDWNTSLPGSNSNFYYIHPLGKDVDLYLTDFVVSIYSDYSGALFNNISEYGYRKLELIDGKYVATGDTVKYEVSVTEDGIPMIKNPDGTITSAQVIDSISKYGETIINRYQYQLGTFSSEDVIELYMKNKDDGGEAYSYSDYYEIESTDNGSYEHVGSLGGFGDGGYRVNLQTDMMLDQHYYQDANLNANGYQGFGEDEEARALASAKSMPLSALDPSGERVYFGIIGMVDGVIGGGPGGGIGGGGSGGTFGSPLPGGLSIALIAGLFGLGFWYIRRRKANVA